VAGGVGTLLGPEDSFIRWVEGFSADRGLVLSRGGVVVGCGFRPYLENFTVDASIFVD
jgi:hypothetical protein